MDKSQSGSNFYMLTAQILNDKNLSHAEKLTMAILNGLAREDGSCYPSNEWLGEKLDIHPRKVQVVLENLEKNNYIKRQVVSCASNPFKKYRIIFVRSNFKLCLPDAENGTLGNAENGAPVMPKTACIIDKKELIEEEEEGESGGEAPPPLQTPSKRNRKKLIEEKQEVAPRVWLTPSQQESLKKRLEPLGLTCEACYTRLSDWYIGKEIQGGKSDYLAICNWVIDQVKLDRVRSERTPPQSDSFNKEIAAKVQARYPHHKDINYGHNYIEFVRGPNVNHIKYTDGGFKDQVIQNLRIMGLNFRDL